MTPKDGEPSSDTLADFYIRIAEASVLGYEPRFDKPDEVVEVNRAAPMATIELMVMSPFPGALLHAIPNFQAVFRVRSKRQMTEAEKREAEREGRKGPDPLCGEDPYAEIFFRIMRISQVPGSKLKYRLLIAPLPDATVKGGMIDVGGRMDQSAFLALVDDAESLSPIGATGAGRRHFSQEIEEINFRDPATGETGIAIKSASYAPLKVLSVADVLAAIGGDGNDASAASDNVDAAFDAVFNGSDPAMAETDVWEEVDLSDFDLPVAIAEVAPEPAVSDFDAEPPTELTVMPATPAPRIPSPTARPSYWREDVGPRRVRIALPPRPSKDSRTAPITQAATGLIMK